ncbi:MAG: MarR family transcriptional regulator [Oscillospiraceae bacterium]
MDTAFEGRLWQFTRRMDTVIEDIFLPAISAENLTVPQARILFTLCERGETTVGELSAGILMNRGNCSTMCKRMEGAGLLARTRKPQDERVVCLRVTEQGRAAYERIVQTVRRAQAPAYERMSEQERRSIQSSMDAIEQLLGRFTRPEGR